MSETAHTPGPWKVVGEEAHRRIVDRDSMFVANLYHSPLHEANALVIAAAPKMLEALENIHKIYPDAVCLMIARDAIVLAKGSPTD